MFDIVNKAKKFLNQNQDKNPDEFRLSQEEVDRILKEEIDDKFEALEKQHVEEMVAATKESERVQLAQKLQDEALLRRQVLQDSNSTSKQIKQSLQSLTAKASNDPEIAELQNLLTTFGEVRASSSNTDEAMAQFLVNYDIDTELPTKLSIEEQMNMMSKSSPTPTPSPSTRQSIDDAMNSILNSPMQLVDERSKPELSELDLLKKAMGF
jgi:hypothetical protein